MLINRKLEKYFFNCDNAPRSHLEIKHFWDLPTVWGWFTTEKQNENTISSTINHTIL